MYILLFSALREQDKSIITAAEMKFMRKTAVLLKELKHKVLPLCATTS
jgi:hypothetical protein